ncbi:NADH-quinone oxidoreductase [Actinomycetospora sp. NBRC 106375]|uniref:NADH-quinone oxidoreductase subunit NuoG n=1 Tax=Actinomycetospora sp. NBRC 106375 TaxID=3032207 RepID=UPI0024A2BFFF|nr:NADH-quinone oxidoreductase subunit NuoG [Actinomycetospora sp. NBRC 106375]GLZ44746.1 NADH-quinone oxidoreductase [Actinomycetospora sp. NBRC 106375]
MTQAPEKTDAEGPPIREGHVRLTIDDQVVDAPQGELIIRTCERLGIVVPRFCDHPLLDPAGACRQCLVEVEMGGRKMPKPQASCTMTVAQDMVVNTQMTSPVADKAQQGVMELLLINHPLDCPICDKGGECPLQNQAMSSGRAESRFVEEKRTFAKPLPISDEVLLDRERCVLCQRCTRFSRQIAGDQFIELLERGAHQQIGTEETAFGEGEDFQSYFSGNTIQICPVGALTSASYRFRSRPFDLVSTAGVAEHDSSGAAVRRDWRRGAVTRVLAGDDPEVNEEWIDDKTRFAFRYAQAAGRITRPLVRGDDGELHEASWTDALERAASLLVAARDGEVVSEAPSQTLSVRNGTSITEDSGDSADDEETEREPKRGVGVLPGGRLTVEDAYAYAKFARLALGTNDIDARARAHSGEELDFLAAHVAGTGLGVTYADLEEASTVLTVALEVEEEAPVVFLRLRKAARQGTAVHHLGQWSTPAVVKTGGHLVACAPGGEPAALDALPDALAEALTRPGAVVLVGERAAEVPGLYAAVSALAGRSGAKVAWIPRRAGERGAVDAGALPTLLPGGRPIDDVARAQLASTWGVTELPATPGRDAAAILRAAAAGELAGLVVGGVEIADLPDPVLAREALRAADVVVSLEQAHSEVTPYADVVLPVAPVVNKSGTFRNWEGRDRRFATTIDPSGGSSGRVGGTAAITLPDCRVLDTLAVEMDVDLFTQTPEVAAAELERLGVARPARPAPVRGPDHPDRPEGHHAALVVTEEEYLVATPAGLAEVDVVSVVEVDDEERAATTSDADGGLRLATWRQLLDGGSLLVDEPELAGTARPPKIRVSTATAQRLDLHEDDVATLAGPRGELHLEVELADLPVDVVWAPARVVEPGGAVTLAGLGLTHGGPVRVTGSHDGSQR